MLAQVGRPLGARRGPGMRSSSMAFCSQTSTLKRHPPERAAYARLAGEVARVLRAGGAFVAQGGGCRATFFNYRRKIAGGNGAG